MKPLITHTLCLMSLCGLLSACVMMPPGQLKKESAPGQVMHKTGCNPASGKCKDK